MPLEFADFTHHYAGHDLPESQQRAHFDALADLLECIVRLFWREDPPANGLGIKLDGNALLRADRIQSGEKLNSTFNVAVSGSGTAKRDS